MTLKKSMTFLLVVFLLLVLGACNQGNEEGEDVNQEETSEEAVEEETTEEEKDEQVNEEETEGTEEDETITEGDQEATEEELQYDETLAIETSQQSCIGCHGQNLEGIAGDGPDLRKIGGTYTEEELLNIILNGKGNMPGNLVQGERAENLAAWLADKK